MRFDLLKSREFMLCRVAAGGVLLAAAMLMATSGARAQDAAKYPDWKGAWVRLDDVSGGSFDPGKRPGRAQQPPLTAEYQAVWEANLAERARGGQYYNTQVRCLPGGMPRMMIAYQPLEIIITADVTHIHIGFFNEHRRIYTDGRAWPAAITPTFSGYSIGRWIDTAGAGRYDLLEVETRGLKGPRIFDPSGIPLHPDNQTVVKERIYLDHDQSGHPAGRDHDDRPRPDAPLDGDQGLPTRSRRGLDRGSLRREQPIRLHSRRELSQERGRLPHAHPQGPAAAGFEEFRPAAKMIATEYRTSRATGKPARPPTFQPA